MSESDYDKLRRKNIAERNAVFAEFFNEVKTATNDSKNDRRDRDSTGYFSGEDTENQPPKKKRRIGSSTDTSAYRSKKVNLEFKKKYNTRSRARGRIEGSFIDSDEEKKERRVAKGRQLKVMFAWAKPFEREIEMMRMDKWDVDKDLAQDEDDETSDGDSESETQKKRVVNRVTKSVYDPNSIPSPDEITDAMLRNVVQKSSNKTYCKFKGTSCHQCRQKTMDTKTVCRSGECIGVRGQFCGPCLRGRYGEDAVTVLKDPNWSCPPCRGLCNCSICRTRNGQRPTGILAPVAQEEGFDSVMEYLQATSGNDEEAEEAIETVKAKKPEKVEESEEPEQVEESEEPEKVEESEELEKVEESEEPEQVEESEEPEQVEESEEPEKVEESEELEKVEESEKPEQVEESEEPKDD